MVNIIDRYTRVFSEFSREIIDKIGHSMVLVKSMTESTITYYDFLDLTEKTINNDIINSNTNFSYESASIQLTYVISNDDYQKDYDLIDKLFGEDKLDCNIESLITKIGLYHSSTSVKMGNDSIKYLNIYRNYSEVGIRLTSSYCDGSYGYSSPENEIYITEKYGKITISVKSCGSNINTIELEKLSDLDKIIQKEIDLRAEYEDDYFVKFKDGIVTLVPKLTMGNYIDIYDDFMVYLSSRKDELNCVSIMKQKLSNVYENPVSFYGVITRKFKYYDLMEFIMTFMKAYGSLATFSKKNDYNNINGVISYLEDRFPQYVGFSKLVYNNSSSDSDLKTEGFLNLSSFSMEFAHMSKNRKWRGAYPEFEQMRVDFTDGLYENRKVETDESEETDSSPIDYSDIELEF